MKVLRFDSTGGASGDMILSALVDLGVDLDELRKQLGSLPLEKWEMSAEKISGHSLQGTRVSVDILEEGKHHRHLADITKILNESGLPAAVKGMALDVFGLLAVAEAKVHGTTPDKIHFHEVGAVDSIVDIAGSCLALHLLAVDLVIAGRLPVGSGEARTGHGVMPVPTPAVVELLKGHPVVQTDERFEMVTPTGAALLTAWADAAEAPVEGSIVGSGYGFGHHELKNRPNLLRATLIETTGESQGSSDKCVVLECNIDDESAEIIGALAGKLLSEGALDAYTSSVYMKKQRPGIILTVLCRPETTDRMVDLVFRESTTFGIRRFECDRAVLDRRHETVETPYGPVRIKIGNWKGTDVTCSPEYEDCAKLAAEKDVALRTVYEAARAAL